MDENVCAKLFSKYKHLGGGVHEQEFGGNTLTIVPIKCAIHKVAPPRGHLEGYDAHKISFTDTPPKDRSWGTWIKWSQSSRVTVDGNTKTPVQIEIKAENITIKNLYFFIVQPLSYRSENSSYEVLSEGKSLAESLITRDVIFESQVPSDFPIFPEWDGIFRGRKLLRNRRPIHLEDNNKILIQFSSISESLAARRLFRTYLASLVFALAIGIFANGLFGLLLNRASGIDYLVVTITIFWLIIAIVAGILGFQNFKFP